MNIEILIYQTEDGQTKVQACLEKDSKHYIASNKSIGAN